MRIQKTIVPLLLLLGMLVSCNQGTGAGSTTTDVKKDDGDKKNPIALTQQMTPTPVLPADKIPMGGNNTRPPVNPNPNPPQGDSGEQGEGAELEGYYQLLKYIDRNSVTGPTAWGRHVALDVLDGLFESTAEGSNKYGGDAQNAGVTWKMTRSVTINAYAVYTANDTDEYPGRNPKAWTIYGSDDGNDWKAVHSVQDAQLPIENYTGTVFEINNSKSYQYYRFALEEVEAGDSFQFSELLLYTTEEISDPVDGVGEFYGKLPTEKIAMEKGEDAFPIVGEDADAWMSSHQSLNDKVILDSAFINVQCWADNEGPDRLFDGIYSKKDFDANKSGKLGGTMDEACIVWKMSEQVEPFGYALITGNDTRQYPDRNPNTWVLYGSNDGKNWEALDIVSYGNMMGENFMPHVYTVDYCGNGGYTWFCLSIESANGSMQLCEIILYK